MVRNFLHLLIFYLFLNISAGCNQSDDQREFEREAYNVSESFTETDGRGQVINNNRDPDDWRVGPFFVGLVIVDPAYPNPVLTNDRLIIDLHITGVDAVSGLRVFVMHDINYMPLLYEEPQSPLSPGLRSISLNPLQIARTPENPQGIYRIIIEDGNRNIITYGDVKIE